MKLNLLDQLECEAVRTRGHGKTSRQRRLEPDSKSMPLLRLAGLVATMPSGIALVINKDELELSPPEARDSSSSRCSTAWSGLDKAVQEGRAALAGTTNDYLLTTNWKL